MTMNLIDTTSVAFTVTDGPLMQFQNEPFTRLVDEVAAKTVVTLGITNSTSGAVSFTLKHPGTGTGASVQLQPAGAWTLALATSSGSGSQPIQGTTGGSVQKLQLSSSGRFQYLDANGVWQSLTTTPLSATTFVISNASSDSLSVSGTTSIAGAATAMVGVTAPGEGSEKTLSMTVANESGSHDPTFVIKSRGGGTVEG